MTAPTANDIASAALAANAAPSADDTFDALTQLADAAGHASTVLFNYRRDNPGAADIEQALNLEMTLDKRAIDLRTQAVRLLGAQATEALTQLKDAAGKVDAFLAEVKKIEGQLTVASALIGLAAAALVGDTGGIFTAVGGVYSAIKSAKS
jgi:Flp pilus assembly pilin Flp